MQYLPIFLFALFVTSCGQDTLEKRVEPPEHVPDIEVDPIEFVSVDSSYDVQYPWPFADNVCGPSGPFRRSSSVWFDSKHLVLGDESGLVVMDFESDEPTIVWRDVSFPVNELQRFDDYVVTRIDFQGHVRRSGTTTRPERQLITSVYHLATPEEPRLVYREREDDRWWQQARDAEGRLWVSMPQGVRVLTFTPAGLQVQEIPATLNGHVSLSGDLMLLSDRNVAQVWDVSDLEQPRLLHEFALDYRWKVIEFVDRSSYAAIVTDRGVSSIDVLDGTISFQGFEQVKGAWVEDDSLIVFDDGDSGVVSKFRLEEQMSPPNVEPYGNDVYSSSNVGRFTVIFEAAPDTGETSIVVLDRHGELTPQTLNAPTRLTKTVQHSYDEFTVIGFDPLESDLLYVYKLRDGVFSFAGTIDGNFDHIGSTRESVHSIDTFGQEPNSTLDLYSIRDEVRLTSRTSMPMVTRHLRRVGDLIVRGKEPYFGWASQWDVLESGASPDDGESRVFPLLGARYYMTGDGSTISAWLKDPAVEPKLFQLEYASEFQFSSLDVPAFSQRYDSFTYVNTFQDRTVLHYRDSSAGQVAFHFAVLSPTASPIRLRTPVGEGCTCSEFSGRTFGCDPQEGSGR